MIPEKIHRSPPIVSKQIVLPAVVLVVVLVVIVPEQVVPSGVVLVIPSEEIITLWCILSLTRILSLTLVVTWVPRRGNKLIGNG